MKSLRYRGPGSLEIEESPVPQVEQGEVLIAVEACGVCATDVKTFLRGHPKIKPGSGLGHEIAGTIVEAPGSAVWKTGMRVTVVPYFPCGSCSQCKRQRYSLCQHLFDELLDPGGFSEFVRVPAHLAAKGIIALPDSLPPSASCFAEPVACCLHAFASIGVESGDSLVIIGDGVMGLLQAEIGRFVGAKPIILSGMTPERLKYAVEVADIVVDATKENLSDVVRKATDGEGADKVLVSVAAVAAAAESITLSRKGGAINLFAGMPSGSTLPLDMNRIHYDEILLTGSFGFGPDDFRAAADLIANRKLNVSRLVTSSVPLEQTRHALERLARQEGIKTVVVFERHGGNS